jgi:plasmid stability protein
MAALVVHNVDEKVKARIQRMAQKKGHSMSAEVREILSEATKSPARAPKRTAAAKCPKDKPGLGSRIASRFSGLGFKFEIPEFRGEPDRSVRFDE